LLYKVKIYYPSFQAPMICFFIFLPSSGLPITIPSLMVNAWPLTTTM